MTSPEPSAASSDSKLDALIARINGLGGGAGESRGPAAPSAAAAPPPPPAAATAPPPGRPAPSQPAPSQPASSQPTSPAARVRPARPAAAPTGRPVAKPQAPSTATPQGAAGPKTATAPAVTVPPGTPLPWGFEPTRDEPWRPVEPTSLEENNISDALLEQIVLRFLLNFGEAEGRRVADQVKLPFRLIEPILTRLKMEQLVAYRSATATGDYVYVLTESGRAAARTHAQDCTYYGACPVRLPEYIQSVRLQTIEGQRPQREDLLRAFKDLLINPHMLDRLGPAINSGRGMFLFGFPGNGKTSIAERVTAAFGKTIWIPRAVDVDGDIMRVYDPMNHELDMPETGAGLLDQGGFDKRWVRIRRPTLVAGGELTMDMLEVQGNPESGISEAPLQLKSNCGTLLIDDFGRQKMSVDQLLNRWIVPLEKRYDYLNMSSGKKIQVPFDQLVIFSTNLEPKDLVDDAFLRRIPYKIEVTNPPEADFRRLFEIMCKVLKIPYAAEPIDYLIKTHYLPVERPFRNCQPRDLLLQVRNYCLYHGKPVELKNEYFDFAVDNYFSVM
ncbi:ATP-binding protein [Roseimaritima sediminicola]|uniref:AAA family ATPase n=1 Tax=Roseimaritima sediminicola TaxID=2662066 RepID=UPI001F42D87F|nr:AAA family ATPase [Roseimaritima sediminicola]